jgi:hypothetical protein
MAKFLVETVSTFRMRYAIEADSEEQARMLFAEHVSDDNSLTEFSQEHIGELVSDVREVSDEEYLTQFDLDNDYLKNWSDEQKFNFVNK